MKPVLGTLRIGVAGAGTMGRHHVRILSQLPGVELAGFLDPDTSRAGEICERHGCTCYERLDDLLDNVDALTIAAPTSLHAHIGEQCIKRGVHVLMEKPLAHSAAAAQRLVESAANAQVVLMTGHVERYNPAIVKMMELLKSSPEEIISVDARRLMPFDGTRCMDTDVLHDLLIHDIDLALEIAGSEITRVSASGRPVFSSRIDVAHTRIDFRNHATAVFWTAKCSAHRVRSLTVITPCRYLVADTLARTLTVYEAERIPTANSDVCLMGNVERQDIPVPHEEPLKNEIQDFVRAVTQGTRPVVDGQRGLDALKALDLVSQAIGSSG